MLKKVLSERIFNILNNKVGFEKINEIRMRERKPIVVMFGGQAYFLSDNGITLTKNQAIILSKEEIEDVIYKASEFSIYSVNEELKQGYIVLNDGERIGIAGTVIVENGQVKTLTTFTSLNIRIPHQVKGCSDKIFNNLVDGENMFNTLIISPPGQGKTTFLRDIAFQLTKKNMFLNLLVLDERGEIAGKNSAMDIGDFCDILAFCPKPIGFLQGIRALNPDVILTDELGGREDFEAIRFANNSGVKVIATIHASSLEQVKDKPNFSIIEKVFERYVLLNDKGQAGQIKALYNKDFCEIV